jgi:hypothetical protein
MCHGPYWPVLAVPDGADSTRKEVAQCSSLAVEPVERLPCMARKTNMVRCRQGSCHLGVAPLFPG